MAPFRPENILIIYPKSQSTLVQFGLNDETFMVPEYDIPTRIYKDNNLSEGAQEYYSTPTDSTVEIKPLKNGSIVDLPAFLQYLKLVYGSVLSTKSKQNPNAFDSELANIPTFLVTHYSWSQYELETITRFFFEELEINNLMFLSSALASTYALVSQQHSIVIDVGTYHTDIIPIIDYIAVPHLSSQIPYGGASINEKLKTLLPSWDDESIETLKRSNIFEVVNDDMKKLHSLDKDDLVEDETINVADIITSGRDTREILEERERQKKEKKDAPNAEKESNSFYNKDGTLVTVGKQRFQGCDELIEKISQRVGFALNQIDDINKVKLAWENIIVVGGTSSIQGFKEGLLAQLIKDHLVAEPEDEKNKREQDVLDALPAYKRNKFMGSSFVQLVEYNQAPNTIRLSKYPEYFPEWKKHGYSTIPFLGAQIVSKQIFTHSRDIMYITREKYEETGPSCIWDIEF